MLETIGYFALGGWCAWCGVCSVFLVAGMAVPSPYPYCDGFRIHVPEALRGVLTPDEFNAVVEHEIGHLKHGHVWQNFLRLCFFLPYNTVQSIRQEIEADDNVKDAAALARALVKMPEYYGTEPHPFDTWRVVRLTQRAKRQRDADNLAPGMGDSPPQGVA
jgi:hypothetical protein